MSYSKKVSADRVHVSVRSLTLNLLQFFICLFITVSLLYQPQNVTMYFLSSRRRDAQGHLVKLVRVDQKGHVGAQGLEGLKERRVTLD